MRALAGLTSFGLSGWLSQGRRRYGSAVALTLLVILAAAVSVAEPRSAAVAATFGIGVLVLSVATGRLPYVAVPVFLGFGLRVAVAFVHRYVVPLPQWADAAVFENRALRLTQLTPAEHLQAFDLGPDFISWLAGWVFRSVGPELLVGQLVMATLGALLIVATSRFAVALGATSRTALTVAWVMAFFPQPVLHSALLLREIPFALLITVAGTFMIRWERTRSPAAALGAGLAVLGAAAFHAAALFLLAAALLFVVIRSVDAGNTARGLLSIVGVVAIATIGFYVISTEFGADQLGGSFEVMDEAFFEREARAPVGGAAYPEWTRIQGPQDFWKAPVRIGLFLFAPFPWMITSARQLLGLVDSLLYVAAVVLIIRSVPRWRAAQRMASFLLVLFVLTAGVSVFGINVSNYGTAIRHRAKFASYVVVLAVAGMSASALRPTVERPAGAPERDPGRSGPRTRDTGRMGGDSGKDLRRG